MRIQLPQKVKGIIQTLEKAGFEAFAVGGCVRDTLLGRKPEDWDITTSAKPREVKKLFPRTADTGIAHGTVTVLIEKEGFEVTTYRIDGEYEDQRHPKEVVFTASLSEDLKRRDFTINAMAYNDTKGLVDDYNGQQDLKEGLVRCVGNPDERFSEDALRMMRAVRFGAQMGFSIEQKTKEAIQRLAPALTKVSAERIRTELLKLLVSPNPQELETLYELGITAVVLPEFDVMMRTGQKNPHHCYTVGKHTIEALRVSSADPVLRLALLLHDVAKPECKKTDESGVDHFYGHPRAGEEKARLILRRLKFDNETIRRVCALVRCHDDNPPLTPQSVRRAIVRAGKEQYPLLFAVKRADILAQSDYKREDKLSYVQQYQKYYDTIKQKQECLSIKDLDITGNDLIALGVPAGPNLGRTLQELLELVLEHPEKNKKEILQKEALGICNGEEKNGSSQATAIERGC